MFHVHVLVLPCRCPGSYLDRLGFRANMEETGRAGGARERVFPVPLDAGRHLGPHCILCGPSCVHAAPVHMRGVLSIAIVSDRAQ